MIILVTGGAGFIGSNFLNLVVPQYPECFFINIDKLSYASNLLNTAKLENRMNYRFVKVDITEYSEVERVFDNYQPDIIIHFAAETHVDRSLLEPINFIKSNIFGTFNLLELCRKKWKPGENKLFHHVSTDEVYGSLGAEGYFSEESRFDPSSPYSASKASSNHLVSAYYKTFGIPIKVTNCSNNYGPYQFPEKLIPLTILNALELKPLPVYGDGTNIRDWLYVEDHCEAIWAVIQKGKIGETYNIGGNNEWRNIDVVKKICDILAELNNEDPKKYQKLISLVTDRPGHDARYAIDSRKIKTELGWSPKETFETGLRKTVQWYLNYHKSAVKVSSRMWNSSAY